VGVNVVLVTGPPCAGKNHYVDEHREAGDTVLDRDAMGPKAYERALRSLNRSPGGRTATTWVIARLPGPDRREAYVSEIGALQHVHLNPGLQVLLARARRRPNPPREVAAVRAWLARERDNVRPGSSSDPAPTPAEWWA